MRTELLPARLDVAEIGGLADIFAGAKQFRGDASGAILDKFKAAARIVIARELGIGLFEALADVHMIDGKPTLGYRLAADLLVRDGVYDFEATEHTDTRCSIEFFLVKQGKDGPVLDDSGLPVRARSLGVETYTIEDAERADLAGPGAGKRTTYKKFPRNMLFARCLGNGIRFKCRNAFRRFPVMIREEIEADTIESTATVKTPTTSTATGASTTTVTIGKNGTAPHDPPKEIAETATEKPATPPEAPAKATTPAGNVTTIDEARKQVEGDAKKPEAPADAKKDEPAPAASGDAPAPGKKRKNRFRQDAPPSDAKKDEPAGETPDAPKDEPGAEARATALAAEVGLKPGDASPLAPPADAPAATAGFEPAPAAPTAFEKTVDETEEAVLDLQAALDGVPNADAASKEVAKHAYALGVNHFGSDVNACAAWQAAGYAITKGKAPKRLPTAGEVRFFLKTIREQRAAKASS